MARKRGKVRCSQTPRGCALPTILPIAPSDLGHHPVRQGALQLKRLLGWRFEPRAPILRGR